MLVRIDPILAAPSHHLAAIWHAHSLHHGPVALFRLRAGPVLAVTALETAMYRDAGSFHRRAGPSGRGLLGACRRRRVPALSRRGAGGGRLVFVDRLVSSDPPESIDSLRGREPVRLEPGGVWVGDIRIWAP